MAEEIKSDSAITLSVIIPCFNEEDALPGLFRRLDLLIPTMGPGVVVDVLCIDDGSTDRTADVVAESKSRHAWLRLESHERNRGLGASIETGVANCTGDLIAMLDADATFAPELLPHLLETLRTGYDIVIGSPYHPRGVVRNVDPFRLFISRSLSRVYRFLMRSPIHSFSGIFRVYRREVFDRIEITHDGFAAVSEILVQAVDRGFRVAEVPVELSRREAGESKMRFWSEVRNHLKLLGMVLRGAPGRFLRREGAGDADAPRSADPATIRRDATPRPRTPDS